MGPGAGGEPTGVLADKIKEGGYATHFVGKWHAGFASPQAGPTKRQRLLLPLVA